MNAKFTSTSEHPTANGKAVVVVTYNHDETVTLKTTYTAADGRVGTDNITVREKVYDYVDPKGVVDVTRDAIQRAAAQVGDQI